MNIRKPEGKARILVFSTEKISDPAIDMAGLLKLHYPAGTVSIAVPCSSCIKPQWILHALEKGFDGVFIAADGTDCPYSDACTKWTGKIVTRTHQLMKSRQINASRLKMAAICSVCSEAFVKHIRQFHTELSALKVEAARDE